MSVDLKFVFLLSKQSYKFISTPKRAYLSRFIDEIIIPNKTVALDFVKREKKCIKLIKTSQTDFLTNNYDNSKENV